MTHARRLWIVALFVASPVSEILDRLYKYRIITSFSRELRMIGEDTREFLRRYGEACRWNDRIVDAYKREFLVRDSDRDVWVPVPEALLPAMGQELEKGQRFELYLAVLGATNNRCLFVATEFKSSPD